MRIGLDIGSTTIKCAVLDDDENVLYSGYERHQSHILTKTRELLQEVDRRFPNAQPYFAISGSAGMGLADSCGIPFVQEVFATRIAANRLSEGMDCVIELGGEDAKILFLTNGVEVRMNGSCAGGTGAFIDQMATLLRLEPDEMDRQAEKAERIYTIASRCGVFAKSDIQPLINQGAKISDIAASIYQAVVNQTIAGLAQGRAIKGNVLYLGGPLTFSKCLRRTFDQTLGITGVCPENSLLYVAMGAAFYADHTLSLRDLIARLEKVTTIGGYRSLPALFENASAYQSFKARHAKAQVQRSSFADAKEVHIGIDSGSTTIKMTVIDQEGRLLYTWYKPNDGNPVSLLREELLSFLRKHSDLPVASVTTTGYGEELIQRAFRCDYGIVETSAHFIAAKHFMPDVDFIIDIGGQDMKCFKIENGAVSNIYLNEACSSGCGSFLQTFARALNYDTEAFTKLGLSAQHPVDLGSRCTVFMNSQVKQAQKDGASIEDISAGLSISVVKNALYKVIRCASPEELGRKIVVQGGTFYNEAVLRAFEKEMGTEVIRPDIAGLMGAFGAALYGRQKARTGMSSFLSLQELEAFTQKTVSMRCGGCGNHCLLTSNRFNTGRPYISGNRCDKPVTGKNSDDHLNLYAYKLKKLESYRERSKKGTRGTLGIPLVLNMYELLPFWHTLFTELGYEVKVSPVSSREIYQKGQATIPSDTVCYPAKLTHGHIASLLETGVDTIFYPCMSYNVDEGLGDNHYNCPVVAYYPQVLADNCEELKKTVMIHEFLDLSDRKRFAKHFPSLIAKYAPSLKKKDVLRAIELAYEEYDRHMEDIRTKGAKIIAQARCEGKHILVLSGRPYHVDPEVNHGIDKLLIKLGTAVITEDAIAFPNHPAKTFVLNQWTYHSRLYAAAKYCTEQKDMDLVQLVSFGCGLDAVTTDETREILEEKQKLYTQLKIDEIANLGAANIRLRSMLAAIEEGKEREHGV